MDEILPQLRWLAHLAEPWWPKDNATDMRGVADLFYDHADALTDLHSNLHQARQQVQQALTGATAQAANRQLLDGAHSVGQLIDASRTHGDSISNYATEIENTKNTINQTLAVTHHSIIEAVLDSLQNGPASLAQIPTIKQLGAYAISKAASDAVGRIDATLANTLGGNLVRHGVGAALHDVVGTDQSLPLRAVEGALTSGSPAVAANAAATLAGDLVSPHTVSPSTATPASASTSGSQPNMALIMGGTKNPGPIPAFVADVDRLYIAPHHPGYTPQGLYTPEQFWPVTGRHSETFGQSVHQGEALLSNAITTQIAGGHHLVVLGDSQSATIATLEMRFLDSLPAGMRPDPSQLSFVLLGDPNNPDGGILERFHGQYIPGLDVPFNGATPPNTPYPTDIYTIQYDGISDFPKYPIDLPADANALLGYFSVHSTYSHLSEAQVASAIQEPVSPGYTGSTTYHLIPTQNLPLVDALRELGVPSSTIDLIQPDLRVIVDLGYDRAGYANVPTPAGLFPNINPGIVANELNQATGQGVHDALVASGSPLR